MSVKIIQRENMDIFPLEMAKVYLKIHHNDEDALLENLLSAAIEWVEEASGKTILPKTLEMRSKNVCVFLPFGPVQKVLKVAFRGKKIPETSYDVSNHNGRCKVFLKDLHGFYLKGTLAVEYQTGYGKTAQDIPQTLKNTVLTTLAYLYENRGEASLPVSPVRPMPWVSYHQNYHL